jgi:hypothetical protein
MKVRIKEVTYDTGATIYTVQVKLLGLFWVDSKKALDYSDYCGGIYHKHFNVFFEKERAEKYAHELKKSYIKQKEPQIVNKKYTEV